MYTDIQYKWCKPCQIKNLTNWASGNEKIDNFIKKMQLKINDSSDILFEWIPHNQFSDIEEIDKGGFATVYLAKWKDGPLYYDFNKKKYMRRSDKKVALKCLYNSQNITNEFLNEVCYFLVNCNFIFLDITNFYILIDQRIFNR